ncbi:unnamed protein product [Mytilus coruscus]|uniref:C-type lectin domain-containing protein n=1 Tax=Mytilus coruscus TaxID=42192 RepID=A0A6J8E4R1_MYTCO|nr:unnamed protein product [Mytilus coruscus]
MILLKIDGYGKSTNHSLTYKNWGTGEPNGGKERTASLCMVFGNTRGMTWVAHIYYSLSVRKGLVQSECPFGWIHYEEGCYLFSTEPLDWYTAQGSCRGHDARLAEVTSKAQSDFLIDLAIRFNKTDNYWLGGLDDVNKGRWVWSKTDIAFNYTAWGPNGQTKQNCLDMFHLCQYKWDDNDCMVSLPFVCEKIRLNRTRLDKLYAMILSGLIGGIWYFVLALGDDYWLGGRDDVQEGRWVWSTTDKAFNYTAWGPGEPYGQTKQNCLDMINFWQYKWDDNNCMVSHQFICEKISKHMTMMFYSNKSNNSIYLEKLNNSMVTLLIPNTVFLLVLLFASLVGNGLVVYVYTFKMKSKTDDRYFIPCLAVVDMIACGLGVSFGTMMNFNPLNFRKGLICKLIWSANTLTATSSGLMLLAIAVQRYIKVRRLWNSSLSPRSKRLTITAIITVSTVISLPCIVLYGEAKVPLQSENTTITGYNCGVLPNVNQDFLFGYSITLLLFCLAVIFALVALYCVLLRIIYRQESFRKRNRSAIRSFDVNVHGIANQVMKVSGSSKCGDAKYYVDKSESCNTDIEWTRYQKEETIRTSKLTRIPFRSKRKQRFSIMFFIITLLFCISFFPRIALMIVESVISNFWDNLSDSEYVIVLSFYRGYLLNYIVNPLIYIIFDTVFRTSCKQLCCRSR